MNSSTGKPLAENNQAQPVFSYAQAAKGRTSTITNGSVQLHPSNASTASSGTRDANSPITTAIQSYKKEEVNINGSYEACNSLEPSADEPSVLNSARIDHSITTLNSPSNVEGNTQLSCKNEGKDEEESLAESSSDPARELISTGNMIKKQKSVEIDVEVEKDGVKSDVLVPAPIPAVNFWQQRKEKLAKVQTTSNVHSLKLPVECPGSTEGGLNMASKVLEPKKRNKQTGAETIDRLPITNYNGGPRETFAPNRIAKKGAEGPKLKEDQLSKKSGSRGNRSVEREEKSLSAYAPPPVEDPTSWPTPENVLEEDKRKVQEKQDKEDKDEAASHKPRPKEKWVPVPYIPTVTFNTPMPSRGGRGRGGSRAGRNESGPRSNHTQNLISPGEKLNHTTPEGSSLSIEVEKRDTKEITRATSLPPVKRHQNEVSFRKAYPHSTEKMRSGNPRSEPYNLHEPTSINESNNLEVNPDQCRSHELSRGETSNGIKHDYTNIQHKNISSERRNELASRNIDHKDGNLQKELNLPSRERSEARSDRGRGSYRGRGGHSNYLNGQSHSQSNFQSSLVSQQQNGYTMRQATSPYSPPLTTPFNAQFTTPSRGGRGGLRSQSIPNGGPYVRFAQNGASVPHQLTTIQSSAPMYDYVPMQAMSATTYQPYIDHYSVHAMVIMQLEYYFSIDNLCKDVFLRKHMDSQGFVFLSFIAGFKRIQALTQDFEVLRFACQESEIVELIHGDDGVDRLRRKEGWEKWVLSMEERDESTRNPGPSYWKRLPHSQKSQFMGQMILPSPHSTTPLVPYATNEANFRSHGKGGPISSPLSAGDAYQPETPLSAAVPAFSPGLTFSSADTELLDAETTFNDEEVANLTLVFAHPRRDEEPNFTQTYKSTSRNFSNGSIDLVSLTDETCNNSCHDRSLLNGSNICEILPEGNSCPDTQHLPLSPPRSDISNGPPVMWVKGQRQQVPVSEHNSQELYVTFRARALKNRDLSAHTSTITHPDMKLLYEFWSHFLCRNFNSQMYSEFRCFALQDAQIGLNNGLNSLISYYDEILNSKKKVIPEVFARHFVDLVKLESTEDRPAFERLRAALCNDSLDIESRRNIDNLVDAKLRQDLERVGLPEFGI